MTQLFRCPKNKHSDMKFYFFTVSQTSSSLKESTKSTFAPGEHSGKLRSQLLNSYLEVSVEFLVTGKSSRKEINSEEKKIKEQLENKKENFLKYMDNYSDMLEEFSRLSEPLQKAIKEVIHESAGNAQKNM